MPLKSPAIANSGFTPCASEAEANLGQRPSKQGQAASMKKPERGTPVLELSKHPKIGLPKATQAEARAMDKEVVRIVAETRSNWLRLGRLVEEVMKTHAWEVLGFPNVHSWMAARMGESLSSVYSALRSVRMLEGVPEETLRRIGERNAHALTHLSKKERRSDEWIEKATTLPTKEFKQEVQIALEQKTGLRRERFKTWSVALPEKVYEDMCVAEKKLARSLRLDIEDTPGNRITVWEAFAQWILQTDEETIRIQTEGA